MVYDEQRAIVKHESDRYAQLMRAFRCVDAKCQELEAELAKRVEPTITLNAEKMAFIREFVLRRVPNIRNSSVMIDVVNNAEVAWNAMVAACEVKP